MKTSVIIFKESMEQTNGYFSVITTPLISAGFSVDYFEMFPSTDLASFTQFLERFKDTVDNLIIVGYEKVNDELKRIVSKVMDSPLAENENALRFAEAVASVKTEKKIISACSMLPVDATLIPNVLGLFQGFMIEDREFSLILLPNGQAEYSTAVEKYVIPYLDNKYNLKNKRSTLKYMGARDELESCLALAKENFPDISFSYSVTENNGDYKVSLLFINCEQFDGKPVIDYVKEQLKDGVYADSGVSLSKCLFNELKEKNLRLSVAESFTGGRVVSSMIEIPGASDVVFEGAVTYSNLSKVRRLNVVNDVIVREGAVSSVVAYQMAMGLLNGGNVDVTIATTGIAGPYSDGSGKPVGLCYIAVGMNDGIHTYKFNFEGSREKITETAKNMALFLAIKKIKRI